MAANTEITSTAGKGGMSGLSMAWTRIQSLRPGDPGTKARVRLRLDKALGDVAANVRTSAVGGYIELRGTVPTKDASDRATEVARGTLGTRGVLNFLEIR